MPQPKVHPRLQRLADAAGDTAASAVTLEGYVGPAPSGRVRLYASLRLGSCVEISEQAIVHFEEDEVSGRTTLFVDPSANLTVMTVSTATAAQLRDRFLDADALDIESVAETALALKKPRGGTPGGETTEECIAKARRRCIDDLVIHGTPRGRAEIVCDQLSWLHRILCENRPGGGVIIA